MGSFVAILPQTTSATSEDIVTDQFGLITFLADNLAGVEAVEINVLAGETYVPVTLADGTAAVLDLEHPALPLECGPTYQLVKGVTASVCGVYFNTKDSV